MLRVAIVEDEPTQANLLKDLILLWSKANVYVDISIFNKGEDFLKEIEKSKKFDIIYFDIELGTLKGIDIARQIRNGGYENVIVFTTNYIEHSIKSFEVNTYRYYIKPIQLRDVKESMNHVLNITVGNSYIYKYHGETHIIPWKNIIYIESVGHYIYIQTFNEKEPISIKMTLKQVVQQSPNYILRCQRSYVVNINHIKTRIGNKVIMSNNRTVEISPSKSIMIKDALENTSVLNKRLRIYE